jgi:hypothetical protein
LFRGILTRKNNSILQALSLASIILMHRDATKLMLQGSERRIEINGHAENHRAN